MSNMSKRAHTDAIQAKRIIRRLQNEVLRGYDKRASLEQFTRDLLASAGVDYDGLEQDRRKAVMKQAMGGIKLLQMSMAQSRAGSDLLRKVLPDLAHVEASGGGQFNHVLRIPVRSSTSEEWANQLAQDAMQPMKLVAKTPPQLTVVADDEAVGDD
jgi:hypothetical protein